MYHQPLLPNQTYHLFSRATGSEKLFLSPENYFFFLKKLKEHTDGVCKIYCYALLPNHFHLLAKMNSEESMIAHFEKVKQVTFSLLHHDICDFAMERFSNFLNSYTKAFNKTYQRKGSLFMDYIKRSRAGAESDLTGYVWYIHKNAVHHRLTKTIGEWPFDSYKPILSNAPTSLLRNELLEWFGGREAYIKFHQQVVYPKPENGRFLDL